MNFRNGFPGAQPVSMDRENMQNLAKMPYKVSWKADGTRYMMLIDGKNAIYFIDRDNCIFQVENLTFYHRKKANKHIENTLLDGVWTKIDFKCENIVHVNHIDVLL